MSVLSSLSHFCSGWDSSPWDGDTHNQGVSFHLILTGLRKSLTAVPSDLEFCQVSHHTGEPRVYRRVLQNGRGWGVRNAKGKGDYRGRSAQKSTGSCWRKGPTTKECGLPLEDEKSIESHFRASKNVTQFEPIETRVVLFNKFCYLRSCLQ